MSQNTPIDADTYSMLHVLMGDEELNEITSIFRTDTLQAINNIKDAIHDNNVEMIGIICHKLKSSCRLIGANELADLANTLEKQEELTETSSKTLDQMQEQFSSIIAWLDSETIVA